MPDVEHAFLADAAEAPPGGKFSVLGGGINRISGPGFPLVQAHIALVVGLRVTSTEVDHAHDLRFTVIGPDGTETTGGTAEVVPHGGGDGRDSIVTFVVDLWNITFPLPGEYSVRILVNGSERRRLPLVLEAQRLAPGEGPPPMPAPPGASKTSRRTDA